MKKLTDEEVINNFKLTLKDKILDVGGSGNQHQNIKIHTLVDILRPEEVPYTSSRLLAKNFVKLDVTKNKLPFENKEFDFCLCTHTLEDLANPTLIIEEMSRVSKRGYIATPSMGKDMEFTHYNLTDWLTGPRRVPGTGHHRWLFENDGKNKMRIITKNYPLLYTKEFQIAKWLGEDEFRFYWEGKINYTEIDEIDFHTLINEYRKFMKGNRDKIRKGYIVFYLDNPFIIIKEHIKLFLKRGEGYNHIKG